MPKNFPKRSRQDRKYEPSPIREEEATAGEDAENGAENGEDAHGGETHTSKTKTPRTTGVSSNNPRETEQEGHLGGPTRLHGDGLEPFPPNTQEGISDKFRDTPTPGYAGGSGEIRRPRRQHASQEVGRTDKKGPGGGDQGQLTRVLQPELHHTEEKTGREASHIGSETVKQTCHSQKDKDARPGVSHAHDIRQRPDGCRGHTGRILQRAYTSGPQEIFQVLRWDDIISTQQITNGVCRQLRRFPSMAQTTHGGDKSAAPGGEGIQLRRRLPPHFAMAANVQSREDPSEHTRLPTTHGRASKISEVFARLGTKSRVPRLRAVLQDTQHRDSESKSEGCPKTDTSDIKETRDEKTASTTHRYHDRDDHSPSPSSASRTSTRPSVVPPAERASKLRRLAQKPKSLTQRQEHGRTSILDELPPRGSPAEAPAGISPLRSIFMRIGRQRQPHRRGPTHREKHASHIKGTNAQGTDLTNKHEGATRGHPRRKIVPHTAGDAELSNRQQSRSQRHKQVDDKIGNNATSAEVALQLGPGEWGQDDCNVHTHVVQRHRRQVDQRQRHHGHGQGGDDLASSLLQTVEEESEVAHAPQGQKGSPSSVQAPPTFCLVDSPIPGRRPHPGRVRAPLPPRRQEENTIRVPEPGSDTARLEYNSGAQSDGVGDGALLARRPMVPPARISPVQHGGDTAPGRSAAVEPKEALIASLGMGLSDALREAESKNGVPPAASFARRLSKGTQERYNSGWRRLGDMVRESPRILQEIADDIPQAEILTKLLSTLANKLQSEKKSASTYGMAASAVSHYLQASEPSPRIILANTNKAYRRAHPSVAKNDTIPDLHKIIEAIREMNKEKGETERRDRLAFLLMVLTGRRASDTVRVWRHRLCLRFSVTKLDTPGWARQHRSDAEEILRNLGWLPKDGARMSEKEFIIMDIRAYMGKTSQPTGTRYDPWVSLTENRFCLALCPILATAEYLNLTRNHNIEEKLRYDQHTVMEGITDPGGKTKIKAKPLLVSANGKTRSGLQSTTLRSRIKKIILTPLGISNTPHVLRAAVTSYKAAYGVPINVVKMAGNWTSSESFEKHYFRVTPTPVNPLRVKDAIFHDWVLVRAHMLSRMSLPPLDPSDIPDTTNDHAIAQAFSQHSRRDARGAARRRRKNHQHAR